MHDEKQSDCLKPLEIIIQDASKFYISYFLIFFLNLKKTSFFKNSNLRIQNANFNHRKTSFA